MLRKFEKSDVCVSPTTRYVVHIVLITTMPFKAEQMDFFVLLPICKYKVHKIIQRIRLDLDEIKFVIKCSVTLYVERTDVKSISPMK